MQTAQSQKLPSGTETTQQPRLVQNPVLVKSAMKRVGVVSGVSVVVQMDVMVSANAFLNSIFVVERFRVHQKTIGNLRVVVNTALVVTKTKLENSDAWIMYQRNDALHHK
jgi:hypothetical protein